MDTPFTSRRLGGSFSRRPCYPRNSRESTSSPSHKPRVVSIPVQIVQPKNNSRSDSAIRIQKMWRGFRLRKIIKKIREIQQEISEVERAILDPKTVESLRKDEKERLKMNERLMALLFRLDSIRGFDSAVKDLRKSFIRKAIVLQEKVDSINQSMADELEPVERELSVVKEEKSSRNEEVMDRMVQENNRMMKLMADLLEKSEKQTRMLNRLSERVGQLESVFACEKCWRRAKRLKKSRKSKSLDKKRRLVDY